MLDTVMITRGFHKLWSSTMETDTASTYDILMNPEFHLGRGSFSEVRMAVNKKTGKHVAIKMIKKKYLVDPEEKVMVKKEIEIQQIIQHPHIVKMFDVFEDNTYYFLVLEMSNHGNLQQLLAEKPQISEHDVRVIFKQLVQAVGFLHDNCIIHGDIKPENVLMHATRPSRSSGKSISSFLGGGKKGGVAAENKEDDPKPAMAYQYDYSIPMANVQVKIGDFGLSRMLKRVKGSTLCKKAPYTEFRGTMGYVAPEILEHKPCGTSSDVWSLGVILYEALGKGMKPFAPYEDCKTVPVEFPRVMWNGRSKESVALIKRLLVKDGDKRPGAQAIESSQWFMLEHI